MELKINHTEIFSKTRHMRNYLETQRREIDMKYRGTQSRLNRMDSRTNGVIQDALEVNCRRAHAGIETISRMINAMEATALMVKEQDRHLARIFGQGGVHGAPVRLDGCRRAACSPMQPGR